MKKLAGVVFIAAILQACGGSSNPAPTGSGNSGSGSSGGAGTLASGGVATGNLILTGEETGLVGSMLTPGYVGESPGDATQSQPNYIVIVDASSTVVNTGSGTILPDITDPNNAFVLVATDATNLPSSGYKGISMTIAVGGTRYDYTCTTPGTLENCGGNATISLDIPGGRVTFTGTNVTNADTGKVITINGSVLW